LPICINCPKPAPILNVKEYEASRTPENRLLKDEKKEEAIDAMRDFGNGSIRFNKKMDDANKLYLGIRPMDTSQPDTDVLSTTNHFEHRVRALNYATGDTSKPADAYGVRYAWQVGDEKPSSGAGLSRSQFTRKMTYVVTHESPPRQVSAVTAGQS
jgi:hypothetical protein